MKLNSEIKAYTKRQAFEVLDNALSHYDFRDGDFRLTKNEMESLYKYFIPSIPKIAKEGWQWVAKAVGKKDVRTYINYLYSDGNKLMATDGHRVHWIDSELPQGYYCPKSCNPIEDQGKFPDIERLINIKRSETFDGSVDELPQHRISKIHIAVAIEDDILVGISYLEDAMNGARELNLELGLDRRTSIAGASEFGNFIIMPVMALPIKK